MKFADNASARFRLTQWLYVFCWCGDDHPGPLVARAGIFKASRLEQLFRDGALAEIQPPPTDSCLWNMGIHELGLDPEDVRPPMKGL